jgi:cytochrome c55X
MARYRRWVALGFATALSAAASAAAAGEAVQPGGDRPDAARVQHGKMLYASHCSHCHGFNMVSAGTVTFDLRSFPHDQRERFFESVTNGKDNRMPPWGDVLTQDEIGDIWAYICTGGK